MVAYQTVPQAWEYCHQIFENCKPFEIYKRTCDVYREACFSQKMLTNGLNMALPLQVRAKRKVYGVKTHTLW